MAEVLSSEGDVEKIVRDAFDKAQKYQDGADFPITLMAAWMDSPVGPLLMAGDDNRLHLLSFIDQSNMVRKAALIQKKLKARIELGSNQSIDMARQELQEYFAGERREFQTPLALNGTAFQTKVWEALIQVPYGETVSYADLAQQIGKPAAFRAVAQANAQNPINIIVPCHRIINADGGSGGYNAGLDRKRWLLEFERGVLAKVPAHGG
ncbi:MAG: methylated-DNA--[protein]-cysteine S-methyltransferase [Planctomycetaceae bacterium]|nr:methylated-DNA--[protein]-cysteine S-methyltransferase [Planctomycetaceae bacterium]